MTNPIIIGAGISGLIAALELEKAGFSPIILEATERVGGRVKTDVVNGCPLDHGFQVLLTDYPEAKHYLDYDALNLTRFSPGSVIYKNGKPLKIGDPLRSSTFLWSTISANIGSLTDKMKILKLSNRLKKKSIDDIFKSPEQSTLSYLQDFGFSDRMIHNFFEPFFAGIYLEENLDTSSRMFEFVYKMFGTGDAAIPQAGIQAIPEQLAAKLSKTTFRFNCKVESIDNKIVRLVSGEEMTSDKIIVATDTHGILTSKQEKPVNWKSCYNVYLEAEHSPFNDPIIGLLPNKESLVNNFHFLEDVFDLEDKSVVSVTVVKSHQLSEEALVKQIKLELEQHCGIKTSRVIKSFHIKKALPDLADLHLEPSLDHIKIGPGLFTCGDHLAYGSLNAAMASGRLAAKAAISG